MSKSNKIQVRSIAELTILMLNRDIGNGFRASNDVIATKCREVFGSKTTSACVAWYASDQKKFAAKYEAKFGITILDLKSPRGTNKAPVEVNLD